jgi:hypothetical protein
MALLNKRVRDRIGRIQNRMMTAAGTGTGTPFALVSAAGVGKTGATGQTTTVTYDDLIDLIDSIDGGDVEAIAEEEDVDTYTVKMDRWLEVERLKRLALEAVEVGAMWAVKAATKPERKD